VAEHFDMVIVGGGIHGVGVAQAAVCGGYSVLVLEKSGLAAGSSSRSSKLIHGGLRYLEGFYFSLVRESLLERTLLLKIAPDLVRLQPFYIPIYPDTSRRPFTIRAGLTLYALLAGLSQTSRYRKLKPGEWDNLDGLDTTRLQVVYQYYDAQTNDADLTHAVMQSALNLGATLYCPAEFISAEITGAGCEIQYSSDGHTKTCSATTLVNAAGPWVNTIAEKIHPVPDKIEIDLVQGAHLILEGGLEKGCYYLEVPADRRTIFLLPWGDHALLGTTENIYTGKPADVTPLKTEETYLLDVMRHYFPHRPQKVLDRFAGLRVLPASGNAVFRASRETHLPVDNPQQPRVVSIYGGKLTGYRATAHTVMQILQRTLPERKAVAHTSRLKLKPV
jgi:glycerol-3-phosphate dehydrogenase